MRGETSPDGEARPVTPNPAPPRGEGDSWTSLLLPLARVPGVFDDPYRAFRLRVAGEGRVGPEFPCAARIRVGWDRGRQGLGYFGVQLDVCLYR